MILTGTPYSHNRELREGSFMCAFALGLLTAVVLGFGLGVISPYIVIISEMVFLIIDVIAFGLAGYGVGQLVYFMIQRCRCANKTLALIIGMAAALAGTYCTWAGFVFNVSGWKGFIVDYDTFWYMIDQVRIVSAVRKGDTITVHATAPIYWFISSGAFFVMVINAVYRAAGTVPFCDRCYRWVPLEQPEIKLPGIGRKDMEGLRRALADGDVQKLREKIELFDGVKKRALARICRCGECGEFHYLGFQNSFVDKTQKETLKFRRVTVMEYITSKEIYDFMKEVMGTSRGRPRIEKPGAGKSVKDGAPKKVMRRKINFKHKRRFME